MKVPFAIQIDNLCQKRLSDPLTLILGCCHHSPNPNRRIPDRSSGGCPPPSSPRPPQNTHIIPCRGPRSNLSGGRPPFRTRGPRPKPSPPKPPPSNKNPPPP